MSRIQLDVDEIFHLSQLSVTILLWHRSNVPEEEYMTGACYVASSVDATWCNCLESETTCAIQHAVAEAAKRLPLQMGHLPC